MTLSVGKEISFKVSKTELHYSVCEDSRGCGYYLSHIGSTNNRRIFEELGIDSNRHEFVKQIVGKDYYSSGNGATTQFPVCTTLGALAKVVNALIKMCEGGSDGKDFDWDAFEETGAVETEPKVTIRATARVRVNLK